MLSASARLIGALSHSSKQQVTVAIARSSRYPSSRLVQGSSRSACRWFSVSTTGGGSSSSDEDPDKTLFEGVMNTPSRNFSVEVAEGILDITQFYIRHGTTRQHLKELSKDENARLNVKWQKMMEIFLAVQLYVITGLGYEPNETGLAAYGRDFGKFLSETDDTTRDVLNEIRRETWKDMISTVFALAPDEEIPTLSIVDARNLMHKISSKMLEPDILLEIQTKTARIDDSDIEAEMQMKHHIIQNVLVDRVYLGGSPSLVEEAGFGPGPKGYAKMQFAISDHEGDPLMAQYASHAMAKLWEAAGLDLNELQGHTIG